MTDFSSLIERIEAATEGSRELDAEIAAVLRICPINEDWVQNWTGEWRAINGLVHLIGDYGSSGNFRPHEYTTSIDAARTLMPPPTQCWWSIEQLRSPDSPMASFGPSGIFRAIVGFWKAEAYHVARHDDPTLALLAAILRARQTEPRHDES